MALCDAFRPTGNLLKLLVGTPEAGQAGGLGLKHHPDFKEVPQAGAKALQPLQPNVWRGGPVQHKGTAAATNLYIALSSQGTDRLPQGGAADAEELAEPGFIGQLGSPAGRPGCCQSYEANGLRSGRSAAGESGDPWHGRSFLIFVIMP